MKDRNLWMKKEEKRTAPGLKRALKAVLGHKIVRLAGIAGVSLLFSASAAQTVLADDAGVWQPVENGYYLVDTSLGALCSLDNVTGNTATISEKNKVPSVEKKVKSGENYESSNSAKIGDTVEYKTTIMINGSAV